MTDPETYDAEMLAELYAAEEAMRSDEHAKDLTQLDHLKESARAIEREREALEAMVTGRFTRRALAIDAWKRSLAVTEDVHAAVEAIADPVPETPDMSAAEEFEQEFADVGSVGTHVLVDEVYTVFDPQKQAWHVAEGPADAPEPFFCSEGVEEEIVTERKIIGSYSDVTDEQFRESQRIEAREAARQANGSDY